MDTLRYISYKLFSRHGKGHGIHSPFIYNFIRNVLADKNDEQCFTAIEHQRRRLLHDNSMLTVTDLGAGSKTMAGQQRKISEIAGTALAGPKYARLMFRIARHLRAENIIELGTSLGITTAYLAMSSPGVRVHTIEGCPETAGRATQVFSSLELENITLINRCFDDALPYLLSEQPGGGWKPDLVFFDGNHREEATLKYFQLCMKKKYEGTVFVFDDIYWSKGMAAAWNTIKNHPEVTSTIDIFRMGIVFFNPDIQKQHFVVRY